ncbi:hypothetical protein SDRG_00120 [Saprolegnia diclina VS20]|uniref:RING-type domain-containing protein n=1 Tax=Saprolegnia diclina (strain VS20) TaxID=1156394 RepID=T0SAL6_SAPDV|nr:hypothetical protein SDRG_00120 [Saprolegnia diclina VS20]EQC42383.1 hypothetical protein SDRG_00120 [Saprolegnia diclina VS20]|eukprot:XP_008603806.1 hypothetical protein SDRG_00120 [Saprolegnia diclina VS20]
MFGLQALYEWAMTVVQPGSALWYAAKNGDIGAVTTYLEGHGPDAIRDALEITDGSGCTPLLLACAKGHLAVVHALFEHEATQLYLRDQVDNRGDSAVHHAVLAGKAEVLQYLVTLHGVSPFRLNALGQSPLDQARALYEDVDEAPRRFLTCVDILEQRCTVFEGWVYESIDNLASRTLSVSALQSWKRRYGIVLRTALRSHFELVLYSFSAERRDDANWERSSTPSSVVLFRVGADAVNFNSKQKLFNSKPFAFTLECVKKDGAHTSLPTMVHEPLEFAAVNADGYAAWTTFLVTDALQAVYDPCMDPEAYRSSSVHTESAAARAPPPPSPCTPTAPSLDDVLLPSPAPTAPALYQAECIVCLDDACDAVCVPCGHNTMCLSCASSIFESTAECPVCRAQIREVIKIYRA